VASRPDALDGDRAFFAALIAADTRALEAVLADDFMLIDVMSGSEVARAALLELVGTRSLIFDSIEPGETRVRVHDGAAIITGRTRMSGRFGATAFTVASRYTHVFVWQDERWRLVAAQGTQIAPPPA